MMAMPETFDTSDDVPLRQAPAHWLIGVWSYTKASHRLSFVNTLLPGQSRDGPQHLLQNLIKNLKNYYVLFPQNQQKRFVSSPP